MKVDVIPVGSSQKRIEVAIPADRVGEELDRAYRALSGQVRLRGFRKGKAPRKVLEQRFGRQVHSDVAQSLIQESWSGLLEQQALEPVGRPELEEPGELKAGAEFRFAIKVDVKPEIELENYLGVEVVFPKVEVPDDEVEQAVRARLEGHARLVEVTDRPVQKGDMALIELIARDGDEQVVHEPGTMIRTEADPYFPGVEALLEGVATGEEKTGPVTFAEDARTEAVAGRELQVTVKVLSIQANEVPELNDELASELGFEGGVEGMRAALRLEMQQQREQLARNQARANLLQVLINLNPFEVPDAMVDQHLDMLVEELKLQQAYRGRDPRQIRFSPEQMADLRVRASFAAKGGLILGWVSAKEKIEVTDADIEAKFQELADQRGQTVEAIRGYFQKDEAVDELRARLLEERTLDWLLERAKLIDLPEGQSDVGAPEASAPEVVEAATAESPAEVSAQGEADKG